MYHPRFKGKHYQMGQKMGNIFIKAKAQFPIHLDDFQLKHGIESSGVLNQVFPGGAMEISGITDVTGIDNTLFSAWMMCMGCCLDIDDNQSVEVRGCTAFSFTKDGKVFYGRSNDLPPFLKQLSKSVYYQPENVPPFIITTSSFINGEEGVNIHGLVVAMTFVKPHIKEIKPGLNSVFLVRLLLEKCDTVDGAIKLLKGTPIASACNILLVDRTGEMCIVECMPGKLHIRMPEKNVSGDKYVVTVNHFSSEEMKRHDAGKGNMFRSQERYQTACQALFENNKKTGFELASDILKGRYGFMCEYGKELNFDTIWSTIVNLSDQKIYRTEGNPMHCSFVEDKRLW